MGIRVELTYDMAKALGEPSFEVPAAGSVSEVVEEARERLEAKGAAVDELTQRAALAVNGVLVNHRKGMKTALRDGDVVAFVKAAAGG